MATTDTRIDLSAIKERQRFIWASGDYSVIAARIVPIAERLVESANLRAGDTVLDVATGTGNAAIAAAMRSTSPSRMHRLTRASHVSA
jgi:ubiquinone/menaquinone biosynthesis C-methylase UbiE